MKIIIMKGKRGYGLIVIDYTIGGTHKDYNVLFNSDCDNIYFSSEDEAFENALDILVNLNNKNA